MGCKILIIDDDIDMQALIKTYFKGTKAEVSFAPDGVEGLQKLKNEKFDLIVLDLTLPKADGFAVLRTIRDSAATNQFPIIVLSGSQENADMVHAKKLGVNDFVVKPPKKDELLAMVDRLLSSPERSQEIIFKDETKYTAVMQIKLNVIKVTKIGIAALSETSLADQQVIENVDIPSFAELKIKDLKFVVSNKIELEEGFYYVMNYYELGLPERDKISKYIEANRPKLY